MREISPSPSLIRQRALLEFINTKQMSRDFYSILIEPICIAYSLRLINKERVKTLKKFHKEIIKDKI